jgi:hypothetical protein
MLKAENQAAQESEDEADDVSQHKSEQRLKAESPSQLQVPATQQPPQSSIIEDLGSPSGSEDEDE